MRYRGRHQTRLLRGLELAVPFLWIEPSLPPCACLEFEIGFAVFRLHRRFVVPVGYERKMHVRKISMHHITSTQTVCTKQDTLLAGGERWQDGRSRRTTTITTCPFFSKPLSLAPFFAVFLTGTPSFRHVYFSRVLACDIAWETGPGGSAGIDPRAWLSFGPNDRVGAYRYAYGMHTTSSRSQSFVQPPACRAWDVVTGVGLGFLLVRS